LNARLEPPITTHLRKRAKPLLGTIVEIAIQTEDETAFVKATDAAFTRIAEIHHAMSFHARTSDLSAIANAAPNTTLRISPDTWKTLSLSLEIEALSKGAFNPTVAPMLVQRGVLPPPGNGEINGEIPAATSRLTDSISLEDNNHLRILKRVWIDLGGIAKGYAVDEAVAALQLHNVKAGVVNAGGDLRVFGDLEHTVAVRVPSQPNQVIAIAQLKNLSCATSAMYYAAAETIVGCRDQAQYESVSVIAPSCAIADALTKIVWLKNINRAVVIDMLNHFNAHVALLDGAGQLTRI
jgi:FAD:protein FMN transferase